MAPLKAVKSLQELSNNSLAESLKSAFIKMEDMDTINSSGKVTLNRALIVNNLELDSENCEDKITQLRKYFEGLPVAIQDNLADQLLKLGHPRITKYTSQILIDERTIRLNILNMSINNVKNCLMRTANLEYLTLEFATDELLKIIGKKCGKLAMLKIVDGDITDEGINWIIPATHNDNDSNDCKIKPHGCPGLASLGFTDYIGERIDWRLLKSFRKLKSFSCPCDDDLQLISDIVTGVEYLSSDIIDCVQLIPSIFPQLKSIEIRIKPTDVQHLLLCPNLVEMELNIMMGGQLDDTLKNLIEQHPNATYFKRVVIRGGRLKLSDFVTIASTCQNIEILEVNIAGYSNFDVNQLPWDGERFRNLKKFRLFAYDGDYSFITQLMNYVLFAAQNIEKLEINCDYFHDVQFDQFFREIVKRNPLKQLQQLLLVAILSNMNISENTLKMLTDLPSLKLLKVTPLTSNIRDSLKSYASDNNYDIVIENEW